MMDNLKGMAGCLIIGFLVGMIIMLLITMNFGFTEEAGRLKSECEKDLIRNLECEMRFVKPEVGL